MNGFKFLNTRRFSVLGFSLLSAYILSFLFEGQVLYGLLSVFETDILGYILISIVAHFFGLFTCGFFVKSYNTAKNAMMGCMALCLVATLPFFLRAFCFVGIGIVYRWIY